MGRNYPARFEVKAEVFNGVSDQGTTSRVGITSPRYGNGGRSAIDDFGLGRCLWKSGRIGSLMKNDIRIFGIFHGQRGRPGGLSRLGAGSTSIEASVLNLQI